jgi:pimeloyl-ACP methyl ester carboxylesterase
MLPHDEIGSGTPVLCVPGMTVRAAWEPLRAHWPDGVRGLWIDYPGSGGTPHADPPHPAGAARAVAGQLDDLGLDRVAICGHSLGGWAALELAKLGRAAAVLALAPAGLWRRRSPLLTDARLLASQAGARYPRPLRHAALRSPAMRALALRDQSARPRDVPFEWVAPMADDAAGNAGWWRLFRATRRQRFTGGASIDVPVHVVWGGRDRIARRRTSQHTDELPDHAQVEDWDDCGHVLMWDAPERVAAAIAQLVR